MFQRTSVDQRFSTRGCRVSNNNNNSSSGSNNAKSRAADILETEVDSLKTKLAQAQNDLRSLHQTPLSTPLIKQSPKISATVSATEPSGRPIDSTPSPLSEYNRNRVSAGGASTTTNTTGMGTKFPTAVLARDTQSIIECQTHSAQALAKPFERT